jgi:hypothetical protein
MTGLSTFLIVLVVGSIFRGYVGNQLPGILGFL